MITQKKYKSEVCLFKKINVCKINSKYLAVHRYPIYFLMMLKYQSVDNCYNHYRFVSTDTTLHRNKTNVSYHNIIQFFKRVIWVFCKIF